MFIRLSLLHPFQYRSVSYEPKLRSESVTTNQQFYPDHHLYTQVMKFATIPHQQVDNNNKYFSLNSSPTQSHENLLQKQSAKTLFKSSSNRGNQYEMDKKAHEVKLSYELEQQKREVQLLQAANHKLKSQLDFKQKELHVYRAKYQDLFKTHQQKNTNEEVKKLKQEVIDLQEKYNDLEKEHISEIALLKSNLNNSIFQEDEEQFCETKIGEKKFDQPDNALSFAMALNDQKNNPFQDETVIQKYNQIASTNTLTEIQLQIQLLKEENNIYKEQILRLVGENEQSYGDVEKQLKDGYLKLEEQLHSSISAKVIQLENENQNLKAALTIQQIEKVREIKDKLDELDVLDEETVRMPMFHKKNKKSEIEIEFDFTNNQIIRTKIKSSDKKLEEHIKENLQLKNTIKELQDKLNDSKLKPQSHKNLLQKLISQQYKKQQLPAPKQVAERSQVGMDKVFAKKNGCVVRQVASGNNHNQNQQQSQPSLQLFSSTSQIRASPLQRIPAMNLNLTSLSPIACKQYYAMAGIGVKQSSQSPIHYK